MQEKKTYLGKQMTLYLKESSNQTNLFSSNHTKFDATLLIEDSNAITVIEFPYQYNTKVMDATLEDVLETLHSDMGAFDMVEDLDEYAKALEITRPSEAIESYKISGHISEKMHEAFTEEELDQLFELINNGWEVDDIER